MEEVSHVEENTCSAGCINPLLQHGIGDYYSNGREVDTESVTASEENVPLVQGAAANPDRLYLIFWASFISLSILVICLYSTGYLVPGTVLLSGGFLLVVGILAKRFCGHVVVGRRRDLYSQI